MARALGLFALVAAACNSSTTGMLVKVENRDLRVPDDVDGLDSDEGVIDRIR
jgi:hypothetical protein